MEYLSVISFNFFFLFILPAFPNFLCLKLIFYILYRHFFLLLSITHFYLSIAFYLSQSLTPLPLSPSHSPLSLSLCIFLLIFSAFSSFEFSFFPSSPFSLSNPFRFLSRTISSFVSQPPPHPPSGFLPAILSPFCFMSIFIEFPFRRFKSSKEYVFLRQMVPHKLWLTSPGREYLNSLRTFQLDRW